MTYRFSGRERVTIEIDGLFDPAGFGPRKLALPERLELALHGGFARVSLFAFFVEELDIEGVPFVRPSYPEVLWRIDVRDRGEPAWWVACCDLAALGPRMAARRWVRYPTREAKELSVTDHGIDVVSVVDGGAAYRLALAFGAPNGEVVRPPPRRLVVGRKAEWEVPWGDDESPGFEVPVRIDDSGLAVFTVGAAVAWSRTAAIRHGRQHRCGTARRR